MQAKTFLPAVVGAAVVAAGAAVVAATVAAAVVGAAVGATVGCAQALKTMAVASKTAKIANTFLDISFSSYRE
jgi:hypothetical protein